MIRWPSSVAEALGPVLLTGMLVSVSCAPPVAVLEEGATRSEVEVPSMPAGVPAAPLVETVPETAAPGSEELGIREIKVIEDNGQQGIFVKLRRPPAAVSHFTLADPPRIVIAVASGMPVTVPRREYAVDNPAIKALRTESQNGKLRLVVALKGKTIPDYSVDSLNDTLVAFLGEPRGSAEPVHEQVVLSRRALPTQVAAQDRPASGSVQGAAPAPSKQPLTPAGKTAAAPPPEVAELPMPASLSTRKKLYYGQPISLDLKEADIHNVLRLLAEVSKLNIVATDDVAGKVTLRLFEVPWDQALDIVLRVMNLESVREGNVLRISSVARLREEREEIARAQKAAEVAEPLQVAYIRVNYTKASKLAPIINGAAEELGSRGSSRGRGSSTYSTGVLSDRGSVLVDEFTNTLVVRDIAVGIRAARELVRQLDVQTPQVLIESNIVEATTNVARDLGVQWGYRASVGPQTGTSTGKNFPGTIDFGGSGLGSGASGVPFLADFPALGNFAPGSGSALDLALGSINGAHALDVRLSALEEEGKARVISRPRVVTLNNVAATIKSLTIIRVRLPTSGTIINTGAGGSAGASSSATEKIETGIVLKVTPQVSSDGYVLLDMFAKSSQADFSRTVDNIPTEVTREATSNVLVHDGQTVVIGGIYRNNLSETERGVPFLRNLPSIGWLFRGHTRSARREDLLLFLTPHVLTGGKSTVNLPKAGELWQQRGGGQPG